MKKILFAMTILLASTQCFGEVFVFTEKDTKEVLFISEQDNVVIDEKEKDNIEKTVLPNDIAFYSLTEAWTDYKLSGKKFVLNTAKVSARENAGEQEQQNQDKKQSDFESAKQKLIGLGLTDSEVDALR